MGSDEHAVGVITENQLLNSSFIVVEDSLFPKATIKSCVSRAILITDKYASFKTQFLRLFKNIFN